MGAEALWDVARAAGCVAESSGGAALDPEDGVGVSGFEQEFEVIADVGGALAEAGGFVDFAESLEFAFESLEGVDGAEIGIAACFQEVGAVDEFEAAEVAGADRERGEEELRTLTDGLGGALDGRGGDAFASEHGFGVAGQLVKAGVGEGNAKVLAGDVFELVGFVEDDGGGFGQDAGVGRSGGLLFDGEVGEEEVVVDDDDVALKGLATHLGDEALLPVGAGLAEADFAAGVEFMPEVGALGEVVDLGAIAGLGGALPLQDGVELRDFFEAGEQRIVAQGVEFLLADVVGAALHVADAEGAEEGFEEGDVLEEELFLKIFGSGGDDDALLVLSGPAERREEIREGFAGAGAGFDDEMAVVGEGLLDLLRHGVLAGAMFEG